MAERMMTPCKVRRPGWSLIEAMVVVGIIACLIGLTVPAVMKARDYSQTTRCRNNLRQLGVGLHLYEGSHTALPPGCSNIGPTEQYPHMSWLTRLLPYVDQTALWQQTTEAYRQARFFETVPPHQGLGTPVGVFVCPLDRAASTVHRFPTFSVAFTSYIGSEGTNQKSRDGLLFFNSKVKLSSCADGTSRTIMVGERPPSKDRELGWWYAGWGQSKDGSAEMILGARELPVGLTLGGCPVSDQGFRPPRDSQCDALHFWSPHAGGGHFLFADGAVLFGAYSLNDRLPALMTRAGGEAVEFP
jgi:prepilin-type processing-associated H-X9-DG protein